MTRAVSGATPVTSGIATNPGSEGTGFTISALADLMGMSVRNIRAYQSRGILPPPQVRGRVAFYGFSHVARLSLIQALQRQGFSLEAIRVVVDAPTAPLDPARRGPTPLAEEGLRRPQTSLPEDLAAVGLLQRTAEGGYAHPPELSGVIDRLAAAGVPLDLLALTQLAVAQAAAEAGTALGARLHGDRMADVAARLDLPEVVRLAVQLLAISFEVSFARSLGLGDEPAGPRGTPTVS